MEEGRELAAVLDGRLDERLVERVLSAAAGAPPEDRVRAALGALIEDAELDPAGTSKALAMLRANPEALQKLENGLALSPARATLAIGAGIQLARSELTSDEPDLASRVPELLRWLEGDWF